MEIFHNYSIKSTIIFFIISFIVFIFSYFLVLAESDGSRDLFSSIFFSIICFLILDRAGMYFSQLSSAEARNTADKLLVEKMKHFEGILEKEKVESLGSIPSAMHQLAKEIASADWVMNLHVGRYIEDSDETMSPLIVRSYCDWLGNPSKGEWIDIVGLPELFSDRYRSIHVEKKTGSHGIFVLRHSTPMLNFLILGNGNQKKVFWGWIPEYQKSISMYFLYSSNDRRVIRVFEEYFEYLKRNKCWNKPNAPFEIDFTKKTEQERYATVDVVNKRGVWTTIGVQGKSEEQLKPVTIGFVVFDIDKEGRLTVKPIIYDAASGAREEPTGRDHREISHYQNDVYVSYELEDTTSGICHYRFERGDDGAEFLIGTFINRKNGQRCSLIGTKKSNHISDVQSLMNLSESQAKKEARDSFNRHRTDGLLKHFRGPRH